MTYRKTGKRITVARTAKRRVSVNRRKPNYTFLFLVFVVAFLVAGTAAFSLTTPNLLVEEINVHGVDLCSRAAVEAAAQVALGQNIILLRKSPIIAQIESISEVDHVKMGRAYPDRAWVRIWERKPDAVLNCDGRLFLVQKNGLVFHESDCASQGITLICAANSGKIKVGQKVCSTDVRHALKVMEQLRREHLTAAKISVDPEGDICLNMGSDFYVKLGQPEEIPRKVSLLQRVLSWEPMIAQKALYLDFSCPSAPVWKPKVVAQAAS